MLRPRCIGGGYDRDCDCVDGSGQKEIVDVSAPGSGFEPENVTPNDGNHDDDDDVDVDVEFDVLRS